MKISDTPSPFIKQPHLFYQPFHFYVKNLNPPLPPPSPPTFLFSKISIGWGPIVLYPFQVKKVTFTD